MTNSYGIHLFRQQSLRDYLIARESALEEQIGRRDENYLLTVDIREWAAYMANAYRLTVPTLHADSMEIVDEGEVQLNRGVRIEVGGGGQTPLLKPGRRYSVHLPFTGDAVLFWQVPAKYQMVPDAVDVFDTDERQELVFTYEHVSGTKPAFRGSLDASIATIEANLEAAGREVVQYNSLLESRALGWMETRKERVLADKSGLEDLGIPVRQRSDAPATYTANPIKRRPAPKPRGRTQSEPPRAMEPVLADDFYEHICRLVRSTSRSIERLPAQYINSSEETLRDHYLTMLNSHYEGNAVGEAFQVSGKTDILVRVEDENVFVAECKIWSGQKAFGEAINQLFRYVTWRDTKLALIVFAKGGEATAVIEKARQRLEEHPQFKQWEGSGSETEFRAEVGGREDPHKVATLTTFIVPISKG